MSKLSSRALGVLARYAPKNTQGKKEYVIQKEYIKNTSVIINNDKKINAPEPEVTLPIPDPVVLVEDKPASTIALTTREHDGYRLTEEQNNAVDLAETGEDLKIEAYAGAGKTSTLSAISSTLPGKKGLYIAFNKAIADEAAQKFPDNVECRTAHSLAYKAVGYKFKNRFRRLSGSHLAENYLHLDHAIYGLSPAAIGSLVISSINRFTQSADLKVTRDHTPWFELRTIEDKITKYALADQVTTYARQIWERMIDLNSDIPITHDTYLKLWSMSAPEIHKDFILFDEAQDASPVMLDLVCNQDTQKIFVGDRYQQIYSWRGAINAMQTIDTKGFCKISQSFRFGQSIADIANTILNENLGAGVNIRGFEKIPSTIAYDPSPTAILCRTNGNLINTLINRLEQGNKVAVSGGCGEVIGLLKAADQLIENGSTNHKDLMLFQSWDEVVNFSETESGSDLAPLVRLVNKHDISQLVSALEKTNRVHENQADLILSTAHKSKGREWSSVRLEDDFRHLGSKGYTEEESNLLYVAATRAIENLDISDCEAVQEILSWEKDGS